MDMMEMDQDVLRTHELFHGQKCTESAILKAPHGQCYAKILMLFRISVSDKTHDIVLIQVYDPISNYMLNEDDHNIGFQQVHLEDASSFFSPEEFVCTAFIINTLDNCIDQYFIIALII